MSKPKLVRITTIPLSLEKLLEGQLGFMKQYYDVTAISSDKDRLEDYGKNEGVKTFYLNLSRKITPFKDIISVIKLYVFLKKEKPLIMHSHTPKAGIVGMLASYLAGVPIRLHTVAGLPLMEASGLKLMLLRLIEQLTYRCATGVYPNSYGLYDFIIKEKFTTQKKLKVIGEGSSNGINTSFFTSENYPLDFGKSFRKELGIPENDFVFIFVGRVVRDKGIHELVLAFQKLISEKNNIFLLLVGPLEKDLDPLSSEILEIIQSLEKIKLVGYREDVRPYFMVSDVLTFPSYREGFPNVVMQAGAMGISSIVSNINGCNEIIKAGKNGILIPTKDANSLYSAMKQLYDDGAINENLRENNRTMIKDRYERKEIWNEILTEYETTKSGLK